MVASPERPAMDPASFPALLSGLAAQAQIFLGILKNPLTGAYEEVDLPRAQILISTLRMLQAKTEGNRDEDESKFLQALLTDLQLRYVEKRGRAADRD